MKETTCYRISLLQWWASKRLEDKKIKKRIWVGKRQIQLPMPIWLPYEIMVSSSSSSSSFFSLSLKVALKISQSWTWRSQSQHSIPPHEYFYIRFLSQHGLDLCWNIGTQLAWFAIVFFVRSFLNVSFIVDLVSCVFYHYSEAIGFLKDNEMFPLQQRQISGWSQD